METRNISKEVLVVGIIDSITDRKHTTFAGELLGVSEENLSHLHLEFLGLTICAIEASAFAELGAGTPEKNAFLDHFYDKLYEHYLEVLPVYQVDEIFSFIDARIDAYANELTGEDDSLPQIGKAFATFCSKTGDQKFIRAGNIIFWRHVRSIGPLIKRYVAG